MLLVVNITTQTLLAVRKTCPDLNKLIKKIYFKISTEIVFFCLVSVGL
jgi:hypothetical protein